MIELIRSMTAFARTSHNDSWGSISLEIRSVNNRYLDANFRLPEEIRFAETAFREQIATRLGRGKIDCSMRLEFSSAAANFAIDEVLLSKLIAACDTVRQQDPFASSLDPLAVLRWPGVLKLPEPDLDLVLPQLHALLDNALNQLIAAREREGSRIAQFVAERCEQIEHLANQAQTILPAALQAFQESIRAKLDSAVKQLDLDRLEQELVMLANRADVAEEIDRLRTHVEEVRHTLDDNKPVGRRLDFLMQELNREANTLGSKSISSELTGISVDLKVLIEQMREQIQNVE